MLCTGSAWRGAHGSIAGEFCVQVPGGGAGAGGYRDAAPATLALLAGRCNALGAELAGAEARLHSIQDVASLRGEGAGLSPSASPSAIDGHAY